MKKNPRDYKVNGKQFSFILDGIRNSSAISDGECQCKDDESLVRMFFEHYENEFNFPCNKRRFPNEVWRIGEYLKGLPSCINIPFDDYTIASIGKKWGYCTTPAKEAAFVNSYWVQIGNKLLQLKRIYGIEG